MPGFSYKIPPNLLNAVRDPSPNLGTCTNYDLGRRPTNYSTFNIRRKNLRVSLGQNVFKVLSISELLQQQSRYESKASADNILQGIAVGHGHEP
jgi:hypothetical protein